jgi:hypothetical protein
MNVSKQGQYSSEEMKMYLLHKAISQPERRRILTHLKIFGQVKTSVLLSVLDLSKASVKDGLNWLTNNQIISIFSKENNEIVELNNVEELLELDKKVIELTILGSQKFMQLERRKKQKNLLKFK